MVLKSISIPEACEAEGKPWMNHWVVRDLKIQEIPRIYIMQGSDSSFVGCVAGLSGEKRELHRILTGDVRPHLSVTAPALSITLPVLYFGAWFLFIIYLYLFFTHNSRRRTNLTHFPPPVSPHNSPGRRAGPRRGTGPRASGWFSCPSETRIHLSPGFLPGTFTIIPTGLYSLTEC